MRLKLLCLRRKRQHQPVVLLCKHGHDVVCHTSSTTSSSSTTIASFIFSSKPTTLDVFN
jgi:hypothetical protein